MNRANAFGGIVVVLVVAIVSATAASRAQPAAEAPDPTSMPEFLASDLIGRPVRSANGEAVGEITDLVLSPADTVTAAVLSVGGIFGIGAREVQVPFDKLVVVSNRSTVLVTMSKDQVAAEPEFSSDELRKTSDANGTSQVTPPAQRPDAGTQAEANAEAADTFAADDPRVAKGLAENKEVYDREHGESQR